jgi:diaminopimelate epimerase
MRLKFSKMQGLGNDFVVLNAVNQAILLTQAQLQRLADRRFGVGCDQILQIEPPRDRSTDFHYRIFNADGGEVEQCGNGARCFAKYVHERGLTEKTEIRVSTASGIIVPRLRPDGQVTVEMGLPEFEPSRIPFAAAKRALTYELSLNGKQVEITALSMGNPHAVQIVSDVEAAPVTSDGPLVERHPRFPQRANAGYMEIVHRRHIKLRVYERGAGETLSCGTGACAAVVAGVARGLLERQVRVSTRGGDLDISWAADDAPVMMTGPAVTVYDGEIEI